MSYDGTEAHRPTRIYKEPWEVIPKLQSMGLTVEGLRRVARVARNAAANGETPFHALNAGGTFAYHYGVFALRDEYATGEKWVVDRAEGIEAIRSVSGAVRVAFSNVDLCCNDFQSPKPRSKKGDGARRICTANYLFESLPEFYPVKKPDGIATYYFMLDPDGACELSLPIIEGDSFKYCIERIYISLGEDELGGDIIKPVDEDGLDDFDPVVVRK
jgi:hypothetical protein